MKPRHRGTCGWNCVASCIATAVFMLMLSGAGAEAAAFAEVESTVLGGGWFQYRVKMLPDPFFRYQCLTGLEASRFTNRSDVGTSPADWSFVPVDANDASWTYTNDLMGQSVPYERTFTVRSSETAFRHTNGFFVMYRLWPQSFLVTTSFYDGMMGYLKLDCLVPCPPAQADGSPTNLLSVAEIMSDVQLTGITTNTVSFDWGGDCTVLIQGSTNLNAWTPLSYALGYEGFATTWTSSVPLLTNRYFYRAGLVSMGHNTNWAVP